MYDKSRRVLAVIAAKSGTAPAQATVPPVKANVKARDVVGCCKINKDPAYVSLERPEARSNVHVTEPVESTKLSHLCGADAINSVLALAVTRLVKAWNDAVPIMVPPASGNRVSASAFTNAVVASWVVFVPAVAVGAVGVPVKAGDARLAFSAKELVTVDAKFASSPSAAASSLSVSKAPGGASSNASTAARTNAVVASWVVLVPAVAVGAVGTPVNAGDARLALSPSEVATLVENAASLAIDVAILASVFSPVGAPSIKLVATDCANAVVAIWVVLVAGTAVGAVGVPVKAGETLFALVVYNSVKLSFILPRTTLSASPLFTVCCAISYRSK